MSTAGDGPARHNRLAVQAPSPPWFPLARDTDPLRVAVG